MITKFKDYIKEDVGAKYAQTLGVPNDEFVYTEVEEKPVCFVRDSQFNDDVVAIYKNPKDLSKFQYSRAISDHFGNFFVAQRDGSFNHGNMSNALIYVGEIICERYKGEETDDENNIYNNPLFVLWRKSKNGKSFRTSFSYNENEYSDKLIKLVQKRYPDYKFYIYGVK